MMISSGLKNQVHILSFIGLLCQAVSCGSPSPVEDDPPPLNIPNSPYPVPSSLDCPTGTNLTWQNFGQQYLRRYCSGCHSAALSGSARHGAPDGMNFDFASDALAFRVDMVLHAANDGAKMPPGVSVPREERSLFREWLKCGAP